MMPSGKLKIRESCSPAELVNLRIFFTQRQQLHYSVITYSEMSFDAITKILTTTIFTTAENFILFGSLKWSQTQMFKII